MREVSESARGTESCDERYPPRLQDPPQKGKGGRIEERGSRLKRWISKSGVQTQEGTQPLTPITSLLTSKKREIIKRGQGERIASCIDHWGFASLHVEKKMVKEIKRATKKSGLKSR